MKDISDSLIKETMTPPFEASKILQKKRRLKKQLLMQSNLYEKRIAVLSGSTIGEIKNILELFCLYYGIKPKFYEGQYARFYEESIFENKELDEFKPEIIYIHTTSKNISQYPHASNTKEQTETLINDTYKKFESVWESLQAKYNCPIIINNFEQLTYRIMGNADSYNPNGRNSFIRNLNEKIYKYVNSHKNIYINDINYLSSRFGLERWADSASWYLYKYALSINAVPDLCRSISLIIKSIYGKNKKALILDLDNTLWGGVIGDDGADKIQLGIETPKGMAYSEFQDYLKGVSELGIMLNVCSKNEEKTAESGFGHPSSILKRDDFISFKANWQPKHINTENIAKEINIGLDSLVFVDDNPAEREVIKGFLPAVETPEITSPENYIKELDRSGYFEVTSLSEEDLQRNKIYKQNAARESAQTLFSDYDEYLKSMNMVFHIGSFNESNLQRVTQLINKTNQFNFTTRRYTESEVSEIAKDNSYITLWGRLEDKFGDNGIITAMIVRVSEKRAFIDLWVMSCRVFKRGVEYSMLNCLIQKLKEKGVNELIGIYRPTAKNIILKDFYKDAGFKRMDTDEEDYSLNIQTYNIIDDKTIEVIHEQR